MSHILKTVIVIAAEILLRTLLQEFRDENSNYN